MRGIGKNWLDIGERHTSSSPYRGLVVEHVLQGVLLVVREVRPLYGLAGQLAGRLQLALHVPLHAPRTLHDLVVVDRTAHAGRVVVALEKQKKKCMYVV